MTMYYLNNSKILGLMRENRVTQKDLAEILQISLTQTHKKLNGVVDFKAHEVASIAQFLSVRPGDLYDHKLIEEKQQPSTTKNQSQTL